MMVAGQRMCDDDDVVLLSVEPPVRFVAQSEFGDALSALEGERTRVVEIERLDESYLAGFVQPMILFACVHGGSFCGG